MRIVTACGASLAELRKYAERDAPPHVRNGSWLRLLGLLAILLTDWTNHGLDTATVHIGTVAPTCLRVGDFAFPALAVDLSARLATLRTTGGGIPSTRFSGRSLVGACEPGAPASTVVMGSDTGRNCS